MTMIQTFPTGSGSSSGGSITILGCFNTAPTSFVQGDIYYNTTDGLIYTSADGTTWGTGTTPKENILYISLDDHKIYSYTNNAFEIYGGNVEISKEPFNTLSEKSDGLYAEPKGLGAAYRKDTILYEGSIKTKGNYPISDDITNYDALEFTIKWYSESNPNTTQQTIKVNDILGKAVNAIMLTLPVYDSDISYIGCNFASATNILSVNAVVVPSSDRAGKWQGITKIVGVKYTTDVSQLVDSSKAIEDVPVGSFITAITKEPLKHYLLCDGSEYNIADYPYLAQHFKDNLGIINYYGGDGITTFAVPGKPINASVLKLNPTMTSNTAPEGEVIYNNLYLDFRPYMAFGDSNSPAEKDCYVAHAKPSYLGYKFANPTVITAYSLQPRGHLDKNTISGTPSAWQLQASNDLTNWVTLDTQSGITWSSTSDIKSFYFNNTTAYQAYRMYVTNSSNTDSFIIIGNLKLGIREIKEASYIKAEPTYYMELNQDAYINQYCDTYSTDEKIVGKWTNGKPLYRKVVTGNITAKIQSLFTVNENVDSMVSVRGYTCTDGIYYFPLNFTQSGSTQRCVFYKKDVDSIEFRSNEFIPGETFTVILEYTKTTDTENSFDYGMIIDQFAQEALLDVAVTDAEVDRCFE